MTDFIRVTDALPQMSVAHAIKFLGDNAPHLNAQDIEEIANFQIDYLKWQGTKDIPIRPKDRDGNIKSMSAMERISFEAKVKRGEIEYEKRPPAPECSVTVMNFLKKLQIEDTDDLEKSRCVVAELITNGSIKSFLLDELRIPERCTPGDFKMKPSFLPWHLSKGNNKSFSPVFLLKDEFDYFMEHGEPQSENKDTAGLKTTAKGSNDCEKWLINLMVTGRKTKNKPDYLSDAKSKFKVSERAFDRAWSNAIQSTGKADWKKPGPSR